MAAKVATDLKRMQRLYGQPERYRIADYEAEVIELLKAGYLGTLYVRIPARRQLDRADASIHGARPAGSRANDDDPGRVRPGADITGAKFYSYLSYGDAWNKATGAERECLREAASIPSRRRTGTRRKRLYG